MDRAQLKRILEAMLFAAGRAVGLGEFQAIFELVTASVNGETSPSREELSQALGELERDYEARGGGVTLGRVAEGWALRTQPDVAAWVTALNRPRPQRLSTSAVETLAIIAYRQPLTRGEIESVRGVDCAGVLRTLHDRRLIRIVGRREEPGRPILYATSRDFLELFGLKDLSDLPPLKEFEEMVRSQAEAVPDSQDLTLADLATPVEDLTLLEGEDQELLADLDEGLRDLKTREEKVTLPGPETEKTS